MRLNQISSPLVMLVFSMAILPPALVAQQKPIPRYKLIDLGTFGGPHSAAGGSQTIVLNNGRTVCWRCGYDYG